MEDFIPILIAVIVLGLLAWPTSKWVRERILDFKAWRDLRERTKIAAELEKIVNRADYLKLNSSEPQSYFDPTEFDKERSFGDKWYWRSRK